MITKQKEQIFHEKFVTVFLITYFLLAEMAVSFFTWPVFRIGEINPEFSYVMMSWGYPVAIVAVMIAWMVHISVVLKYQEELV